MSPELAPIHDDAAFERFIGEFTSYERMKDFRYDPESLKLERMDAFARDLGDPHRAYPSVHIAGTKGKGTTCLILEALLAQTQSTVGTYMSPHLENIRERIRVSGRMIDEDELCDTLNCMLPTLQRLRGLGPRHFPTFFELMTGLAMAHFRDARVDYAIFEVGLGGRLDATNIVSPAWTAITSIGLEHTQKLGTTLSRIAREKAGILKPGVPLVVGPLAAEAHEAVVARAEQLAVPVHETPSRLVHRTNSGHLVIEGLDGEFLPGPIRGPGLRDDLAVALTLWRGILEESYAAAGRPDSVVPTAHALRGALDSLALPARIEVFDGVPPVVLDGAHTTESIHVLQEALEEIGFPRPRQLVLSVASDKSLTKILRAIEGLAEHIIVTRADPLRSVPPGEIAAALEKVSSGIGAATGTVVAVVPDPVEALDRAARDGLPVVITGSLYLAGALRSRVRELATA